MSRAEALRARGADAGTARLGDDALRDFSRSLPMLLLRAHQSVMAEFRPVLRAHGITEQQWRVLRALTTASSVRATRLAELTLISGPSLTRIVKSLDERGLVSRVAEAGDQRARAISITAAGRRLIATVAPDSEARYRSIATRIGEEDLGAIYALLSELPRRLKPVR
ncbi:MAG: homoprotocatechuate degradation operon regulator HpaR [Burkholderiaceae bacterium]|nr:homoprotocatechuate degradation operon regulator HpaR [Burkholderiaceae bacterium]